MSIKNKYLKYKYKYLELKQIIQTGGQINITNYNSFRGGGDPAKSGGSASGDPAKRSNSNSESSNSKKKVKFYDCDPNLTQDNTSNISRADSGPNLKDSMLRRLISNISRWLANLVSIKIGKEKKKII
jgi:hypothetical protein